MAHTFQTIETNGVRIRCAVEGEGPLVVMVHGFPESWYSWRHQIGPIAAAGFTACAIDVRGYGGSDKPHPVEAYDMESVTGDVAGVIRALSPNAPAVIIGHDWGAPIVWHTALLHPDKVRAVAGLSVPYSGRPAAPLIDTLEELFTKQGKFFYICYFQKEGVAEAEFESDVRGKLRRMYYMGSGDIWDTGFTYQERPLGSDFLSHLPDPEVFPAWMTAEDIDYFVGEFERSGFRGPINRYRNFRRDHAFMADKPAIIQQPALFIAGARDGVIGGANAEGLTALQKPHFKDLRGVHLTPKVGHWNQQEAPEETTGLLIDWLATL